MSDKAPDFNQLNIIASSASEMRAAAEFYRQLGVRMPVPEEPEPFHINGETEGGFRLELDSAEFAQVWNAAWADRGDLRGRVVIGFRAATRDAVDRIHAAMIEAGHHGLVDPFDAFWGARYAILEDPNGVAVGLMSPIDPARRSRVPAGRTDRLQGAVASRDGLAVRYRAYIDCLNARDWDALDRFVHEDVAHNGRRFGLAGYRAMLEQDVRQIPDLRFDIALLVAEPFTIAARLAFNCTPQAEFLGLPVNGRRVRFTENVFYEFREGKIAEVWSVIDKAAVEAQL